MNGQRSHSSILSILENYNYKLMKSENGVLTNPQSKNKFELWSSQFSQLSIESVKAVKYIPDRAHEFYFLSFIS